MGESNERMARNEALFRDANEEIRQAQERLDLDERRLPFLCECEDERCRTIVRLTASEYERVRDEPTRFVLADGHVGGESTVEVASGDGWVVIEKRDGGGEVARETDPRQGER